MKYNKKGLSAIVATILIILITVAAIIIISQVIIPMIEGLNPDITVKTLTCSESKCQVNYVEGLVYNETYIKSDSVDRQWLINKCLCLYECVEEDRSTCQPCPEFLCGRYFVEDNS